MKTPREILLQHHAAAEPKLDNIRREVVGASNNKETKEQRSPVFLVALFLRCSEKLWLELVWPCRRTWAGLTAIWLVLAVFNLTHAEHGQAVIAKSSSSSAEVRVAFQEQHRLLIELIGPTLPAEPPRRPNNQPRSEGRVTWMFV